MGCSLFPLGDGCSFLLVQKGTKKTPGAAFDEHLAAPVLIGGLPPDPHFAGDALLFSWALSFGGQNQVRLSFLPRPTGAYSIEI